MRNLVFRRPFLVGLSSVLIGCASGPEKPKPAELPPNAALIGVRQVWSAKLGGVDFPLDVRVNDRRVMIAGSDGVVLALDPESGREIWRGNAGEALSAGVGSDGQMAAVVTRSNRLVVFDRGREVWRQKLGAQVYTAPLVAGARVFVLAGDRSVMAFDAATGHRLWTRSRPGESLVLRQSGVLLPVEDTLVAGVSGRLVGFNPLTGSERWEAPLATPRGINDVERLVDLVSQVSRQGSVVCARAFQTSVGCVDTRRGTVQWTQPASGSVGVAGNMTMLFGSEADGTVVAWSRASGERRWSSDRLRYRGLTAPVVAGRSVVVGDGAGLVHMLSVEDGSPLNRLSTDGSAIAAAPVLAAETLVVVTRNGGVFGFRPQ